MKLALLMLSMLFASSQDVDSDMSSSTVLNADLDYRLGVGDEFRLSIQDVDVDIALTVSNSGRVHVPYVGIMSVSGKTAVEVEEEIALLLVGHQLLTKPAVSVNLTRQQARPVYVLGAVTTPGQFVIANDMYLLDAITKAGGLLSGAGGIGTIHRQNTPQPRVGVNLAFDLDEGIDPPEASTSGNTDFDSASVFPGEEVIEFDLDALIEGTDPTIAAIQLQGGDIVHVPRAPQDLFFVIGDVEVPGTYQIPRQVVGGLTVSQAIVYAGGILPTASREGAFLMRRDEFGEHQAVAFDFSKILEGEEPDFPIQPNDILYVPNSAVRTVTSGLIGMVPRFIQQFLIF